MSSLTDIVFLLLIFFMLTSSFVTPNALKLLLPKSSNPTMAKQTVTVSITKNNEYFVNKERVSFSQLRPKIGSALTGSEGETIVVAADKSVTLEELVKVMNIGKDFKAKVILATEPE